MKRPRLRILLPVTLVAVTAGVVGYSGSPSSAAGCSPAGNQIAAGATASKCAKFAGIASSGNKNSLDPAQQPTDQNSIQVSAA
jgi:hypothetical protein